jgi:glycosyltransferase involved in cell wall biosynthesis
MTTLIQPVSTPTRARPIRVCFLIDRLTTAGTETQLVALIRSLDPGIVHPYLVLLDGEDEVSRSLEPHGCPVLRLGVKSLTGAKSLARVLRFSWFLREERIDVLQVYFPDSTYFGSIAALLGGVRLVRTRNNLNHWMTPTHRILGRLLNRCVAATIANSEPCRQAVLVDENPRPETVVVLENGVDLERFSMSNTSTAAHQTSRPMRVGVVSNLRSVKGLDVFVEAAHIIARERPGVVFEVAGEGELRPALERRAAELRLGKRFVLRGSTKEIPAFLQGLDVAVLCSRSEGMPNAVLEYMAAERAIVATAVGGTVHLIDDGVHGLLVPPNDPVALAAAIDRLLGDSELRARLGHAARRRVEEQFSRAAMVRRFENFYEDLVGRCARVS